MPNVQVGTVFVVPGGEPVIGKIIAVNVRDGFSTGLMTVRWFTSEGSPIKATKLGETTYQRYVSENRWQELGEGDGCPVCGSESLFSHLSGCGVGQP